MIDTWRRSLAEFVPFLAFPLRAAHFPNELAALKVLYLVFIEGRPSQSNPIAKINGWKTFLIALTIHYGERIVAATN